MLAVLEYCDLIQNGQVLGIDIRPHNKEAILAHPLSKKITMFEGSSFDNEMINKVKAFAKNKKRIMIYLDSEHTQYHVVAYSQEPTYLSVTY